MNPVRVGDRQPADLVEFGETLFGAGQVAGGDVFRELFKFARADDDAGDGALGSNRHVGEAGDIGCTTSRPSSSALHHDHVTRRNRTRVTDTSPGPRPGDREDPREAG